MPRRLGRPRPALRFKLRQSNSSPVYAAKKICIDNAAENFDGYILKATERENCRAVDPNVDASMNAKRFISHPIDSL